MRTKAIFATCILIAVLVFTAIACQSDNSGSAIPNGGARPTNEASATKASDGSTEAFDPCTLITKAEATAALGEGVDDGALSAKTTLAAVPGVNVTAQTCRYDSPTTVRSVSLDLWSVKAADAGRLKDGIDQMCAGKEAISSVGDTACWYDSDHKELQVVKGRVFLDITVFGLDSAEQALMTLARSALGPVS